MRRLLPHPAGEIDVRTELWAESREGGPRPWVIANMIASLDGAATIDGRSGQLGGPPDKEVFHALRGLADVILVGAGTVRAERYGPPRHDPADTERRIAAGMTERARIAIVTSSLELETDLPLFGDETARPLVLTGERSDPARRARLEQVADVVTAGEERVDAARAIDALGALGATTILCEGGPTLLGGLHDADLVDEWCVTIAPIATAGEGARIAHGGTALARPLELDRLWEEAGMLFLREIRPRS